MFIMPHYLVQYVIKVESIRKITALVFTASAAKQKQMWTSYKAIK